MSEFLKLDDVAVEIKRKTVISKTSLSLAEGGIACVLGPSGCGKTTLLRAIAGFCSLSSGEIQLNGKTISSTVSATPAEKRNIGFVFQDHALFPHLSVRKNIEFGILHLNAQERRQRVEELLSLIKLQNSANKHPHELSGGEQQRIALARALAPKPRLLLLDEPFSSLDTDLRESLAFELRSLLHVEKTTAIMVTHDINEAFAFADQLGVMFKGQLLQWGSTDTLYDRPKTRFVAEFITHGSFLQGEVNGDFIDTEIGRVALPIDINRQSETGAKVDLLVRANNLKIEPLSTHRLELVEKYFRGSHFIYRVKLATGLTLPLLADKRDKLELHQKIGVRLDIKNVIFFPIESSAE